MASAVCGRVSYDVDVRDVADPLATRRAEVPLAVQQRADHDLTVLNEGLRDAENVSVRLKADGTRPGASGGRATVENWPTGDGYRPELGEISDGTGTWEFEPAGRAGEMATVSLAFTEPGKFGVNDTLDTLTVEAVPDRIVLYENDEPDICPRCRLESGTD